MVCSLRGKCTTRIVGGLSLVLFLLSAGLVGLIIGFEDLFRRTVAKEMIIVPGSGGYESWYGSSVPGQLTIYIFNITNPEAILTGEKPILQEIGPYVYKETRLRDNVVFSNETIPRSVDFDSRALYHFQPNLSVGLDTEGTVTTLNLLDLVLGGLIGSPFLSLSPHEVIWGYSLGDQKIGILTNFNDTTSSLKMDTGAIDVRNVGQVTHVNGKRKWGVYNHDVANVIYGTGGDRTHPLSDIGSTMHLEVESVCRSLEFRASRRQQSIAREDFEVLVFTTMPEETLDPAINLKERIYCLPDKPCPPRGMMSMEPCLAASGTPAPMFVSQPRFLGVDPRVREQFVGLLEPNVEDHSIFLNVEPYTGITVEVLQRTQINGYLPSRSGVYENMAGPSYMPVLWFDKRVVASSENLQLLVDSVTNRKKSINLYLSVGCGIVIALFVLSITSLLLLRNQRSKLISGNA